MLSSLLLIVLSAPLVIVKSSIPSYWDIAIVTTVLTVTTVASVTELVLILLVVSSVGSILARWWNGVAT